MLEKAEKEIAEKDKIIKILERYIVEDLKMGLPSYEEVLKMKEPSPKKKVEEEPEGEDID